MIYILPEAIEELKANTRKEWNRLSKNSSDWVRKCSYYGLIADTISKIVDEYEVDRAPTIIKDYKLDYMRGEGLIRYRYTFEEAWYLIMEGAGVKPVIDTTSHSVILTIVMFASLPTIICLFKLPVPYKLMIGHVYMILAGLSFLRLSICEAIIKQINNSRPKWRSNYAIHNKI